MPELLRVAREIEEETVVELTEQGVARQTMQLRQTVLLRYTGTDFSMPVQLAAYDAMDAEFKQQHLTRYGFIDADKPLTVEAVCVEGVESARTLQGFCELLCLRVSSTKAEF